MRKVQRFGLYAFVLISAFSLLYLTISPSSTTTTTSPSEDHLSTSSSSKSVSDNDDRVATQKQKYDLILDRLRKDVADQKKALNEYADLVKTMNAQASQAQQKNEKEEGKAKVVDHATDEADLKSKVAANGGKDRVDEEKDADDGRSKKDEGANGEATQQDVEAGLARNYLGCHRDTFHDRDFPIYLASFTLHPAKCMSMCRAKNYKYIGLQDGGECWCGTNPPKHEKIAEEECSKVCSGDSMKMCGAGLKNNVYRVADIGYEDPVLLETRPFVLNDAGSSVTCQGSDRDTRVCKFRNLYYDTSSSLEGNRVFHFYRGPGTIITNFEELRNANSGDVLNSVMELTSITGIYGVNLRVIDVPDSIHDLGKSKDADYVKYDKVHVVPGSSILFARFLPFNIMHHLHDDLVNVFLTMVEHSAPSYHRNHISTSASAANKTHYPEALFDTKTRLVIADAHGAGGYSSLTQYLSDLPVTHIKELIGSAEKLSKITTDITDVVDSTSPNDRAGPLRATVGNLIQFETAVVGMTRHCNWYQYGFGGPQGPIAGKTVDGRNVRLFSGYVLGKLPPLRKLPSSVPLVSESESQSEAEAGADGGSSTARSGAELEVTDPTERYIVIFSRTFNRKILNEVELAEALKKKYPHLKLVMVRLEETPLPVIMRICERTQIAMGMHGSILILSMFMPKGSLLIEFYPWAVPSDNYTPYRTLARLKNMGIKYAAWENNHELNNKAFPDRQRLHGGLTTLPKNEQDAVLAARWVPTHKCCEDPYWLFRIYQDTKVHVLEVMRIVDENGPF